MTKPIKDFSIEQLESLMKDARLSSFRAQQILVWIYARNAKSYKEMTDIPKVIREQFNLAFPLYTPNVIEKQISKDGSRKYLLQFYDGAIIETVAMPTEDGRLSVCCSSQAGCAMGCTFCATGKLGLYRNLTPGEIVDQILIVEDDFNNRVTNVVVMGQGEPFANYDAVLAALRIMNHPKLLNIGARHITLSTCGIIKGIEQFSEEPEQYTLAISLHSARQEFRNKLMPKMSHQQLGALRKSLERYSQMTGRRFSFEYALMKGINDSEDDLNALIQYCNKLLCHVNLIPLNEIEESDFVPADKKTIDRWRNALEKAGIAVSVRHSRGSDIKGACGQLAKNVISSSAS